MRRVILAALPCVAGSVYFFGWRSAVVILVACVVGFLAECFFTRRRREPVSEAVLVTAILFGLIMPPTVPWHVVVIGMLFAVVFTKEFFGGFGHNIFNPALAGRCFVYICFPIALTASWAPPAEGPYGALLRWGTYSESAPAGAPDAITSATPMARMKAAALAARNAGASDEAKAEPERPRTADLFFGRVSGTAGVTSAGLILIGGLYLFITKTASRTIILSVILAYAALTQALHMLGVRPAPDALRAVLGGGFLFGAFFMATDPVSAAKTRTGRIIYGILIAVCTVVIRNFSIFNGGLMFSILLGNMSAPIIDYAVTRRRTAGKAGTNEA